jgi:hypothetical protein
VRAVGPTVGDLFQLLRVSIDEAQAELGAAQLLIPLEPWSFGDGEAPPIDRATVQARSQLVRTTSGRQEPVLGAHPLPLLTGQPQLLGRSENLQLVVDQPTVSRLHAEIVEAKQRFTIRDRGSHNGTLVNDRVLGPDDAQPLRNGDVIVLGDAQLLFTSLEHLAELLGFNR